MSVDNYACLILGLNSCDLDFERIPDFWQEDEQIETALEVFRDKTSIALSEQLDNKQRSYVGFTLARTRSYGVCEVSAFDLDRLTTIFISVFHVAPKLWLIEQQD